VSGVDLSGPEQEELYVLLKSREGLLPEVLEHVLRRIEGALFGRLTVGEMERLVERAAINR
jgi:hypothetical protein